MGLEAYILAAEDIVAVQRKTCISKMASLQERPKTSYHLNGSQWNQTSYQAALGHFCWSIFHEISTLCKKQLMRYKSKNQQNGDTCFSLDSDDMLTAVGTSVTL